ncbi:hypothetical protein H181DRAFT_01955 [Streptomyces sp. WMMB 714]|jgi:hypothetical protein|uniref:hypothetical protein n=1 Tax=Streptomyces sp. WMMB 714 TaxID=1286822 RepID=UPI000823E97D|nr:hypothetical protein [Streptomyces sp. WMMB 714]SCK25358.1 hypothetical protein H181DRAFT_01955 [Streptomyces sp. WMMB 714]
MTSSQTPASLAGTVTRTARGTRSVLARAFTGPGGLTRAAGAAVLLGTLSAQHPNPLFNRAQKIDIFSVLFPNWRFFAPTPAQHDYHILYRTLDHDGETSPWKMVEVIVGRKLHQMFWFPGRRPEKAIFDIVTELITQLDKGFGALKKLPSYRMLCAFLRHRLQEEGKADDVKGFQFTLVRATGYEENDPEVIFVSPYTPMAVESEPAAAARSSRPSYEAHIRDDSREEVPVQPA